MTDGKGWIGHRFFIPIDDATVEEVTCHAMVSDKAVVVLKDGRRLLGEMRHDGIWWFLDAEQKGG